ncbi:MAG TPA: hypothetical protein VLL52_24105 [Anaerolineae bacterium]|nr:hypothetical protein [Anaerolineae bacterium]
MKEQKEMGWPSEQGHGDIVLATALAALGIILLAVGAAMDINWLIWLGGIGGGVALFGQFLLVHNELGRLWSKIDELSKK